MRTESEGLPEVVKFIKIGEKYKAIMDFLEWVYRDKPYYWAFTKREIIALVDKHFGIDTDKFEQEYNSLPEKAEL